MTVPRIAPSTSAAMGWRNALAARRYARRLGGSGLPNVFATLARHRGLFRPYLAFADCLSPNGTLDRVESELLILRTAINTGSAYERYHHRRIARRIGLSAEDVERVPAGPDAVGWSGRQSALLRAADELCGEHRLSDQTWAELREWLDEAQVIEVCLLVGNYVMLAMMLNSLAVQIEGVPGVAGHDDPRDVHA